MVNFGLWQGHCNLLIIVNMQFQHKSIRKSVPRKYHVRVQGLRCHSGPQKLFIMCNVSAIVFGNIM